jgi:outer membrane immunogenic protein
MRAPGKSLLASAAAVALSAASAFAADVPVKAPLIKETAPVYDWTGWYGGYHVGPGVSQTRGSTENIIGSIDRAGAGFAGGVQGGFNLQFAPHWVAGIETDISHLGIDRSFEDFVDSNVAFGVRTNWYGTIRGRLGYTNGPSLFYATGGVAYVGLQNNFDFGSSSSASKTANGWTAGGGIESMLGGNWSARAEYLYVDAGSQDVFNQAVFDGAGATTRFDNRFHVFRYGLNYRFGDQSKLVGLPSQEWTGLYAGVNAGTALSQVHARDARFPEAVDIAGSGFIGGLQAGYNWPFNPHWVAGLEGDVGWLGIDRSPINWNETDGARLGVKTGWHGTLRGRLGYSTGPALLYVAGGAAFVNVKNTFSNPTEAVFGSKSRVSTGWTVGGGIEASITDNWTAKTEYVYVDLGRQDVLADFVLLFDNRFHVFRFGLNYRFGS